MADPKVPTSVVTGLQELKSKYGSLGSRDNAAKLALQEGRQVLANWIQANPDMFLLVQQKGLDSVRSVDEKWLNE